jgi:hypothetical protein
VSKQTKPLVINHWIFNVYDLFGVMVTWHNEGLKKQQFEGFIATFSNIGDEEIANPDYLKYWE